MSLFAPSSQSQPAKSQRILACVRCQQRKVKCNRQFPCESCNTSRVKCVPSTLAPRGPRRRRFPERELLDRLRKYEDLLRENNVKFEPLHKGLEQVREHEDPQTQGDNEVDDEWSEAFSANSSSPSVAIKSEWMYDTNNKIWHAMREAYRDPNDDSDSSDRDPPNVILNHAWNRYVENDDDLLFGSRKLAVDICTLHPEPVQIFRLWQLYLENVNPLLKITHTPSLQGRIIEAAGDVSNIKPTLEALMFSIYCMTVTSLDPDDCLAMFGSSQVDLLRRYQFGCQQALLNSGFLRCHERDCLTALYFYLISVRPSTAPHALSSMLGIAIRIAQRMGINRELSLVKCTPLEAEMRRRLWWSLVLFDTRIGELADFKAPTLNSTWDCKVLINVNDSDLRLEMKEPPQVQGTSTEAIFAVVRSEMADFIRHTKSHVTLDSPPVVDKSQRSTTPQSCDLDSLEKKIEDKYLTFCDPDNPLHFMTLWSTRAFLARCRLAEHHFASSDTFTPTASIPYALQMIEYDTKLRNSPLCKGFLWITNWYFPFAAYIHIAQYLTGRPSSDFADPSWEIMSDNYEARFGAFGEPFEESPFFKIFANIVLQAWGPREAMIGKSGGSLVIPRIVLSLREKMAQVALNAHIAQKPGVASDPQFLMSTPIEFGSHPAFYGIVGQEDWSNGPTFDPLDIDVNQLDWSVMDWNLPTGAGPGLSMP
ncbi:uncharacterized protein LY89DRAFT_716926 [Mollisia scopiformis]|uniref:Zn(2)-C6 fungal-type domain-containing protein n=1 Tax=Mollisia scopiformis TaxID=149040 RepID=A0A194XGW3_MOLSC|nr:uncharacterized protein LY89DRAFT_716926 [Mollisia scopiformis]KUJ19413.1 hypothetical protein LY89DRAFT_716926 [Mollisia scopiformis]